MKQLFYIIRREIMVKVKSRSFYLFALVTPLLFVLPVVFSIFSGTRDYNTQTGRCQVGIICQDFPYDTIEYRNLKFFALNEKTTKEVRNGSFNYIGYVGVVDMQGISFSQQHDAMRIQLYVPEDRAGIAAQYVHDIESYINSEFVYKYGERHEINEKELLKLTNFAKISVAYSQATSGNEEKSKAKIMAFGLGMLLYIMFILFNNNIVKSISEEKSNKLAEVLSMFVKPGKLMIGKILGLAAASLVQLIVWLLAFTTYTKLAIAIGEYLHYIGADDNMPRIDFCSLLFAGPLLGWLIVFFILGFLLNGSLSTIFAICSSGKGSSVPMVLSNMINLLSIYFCMYAAANPTSEITVFASYFPLTSYLVIPAILPYGISMSHVMVSAALLVAVSFVLLFMTGKLYRRFLV